MLVCWSGAIGGAESHNHILARVFRANGIDASLVFIQGDGPLTTRLDRDSIPWRSLGLPRGSSVLIRPRSFLKALKTLGTNGVILPDVGFLVAVSRIGGYRAPIVAVDHGSFLQLPHLTRLRRLRLHGTRNLAPIGSYSHVVVSQAMQRGVTLHEARRSCTLIPNGVDLPPDPRPPTFSTGDTLIIGAAGRLTIGKGLEYAIRALVGQTPRLRIAGEGSDRVRLEAIASELGVRQQVEFIGLVDDIHTFWRECDIGIMPSVHSESFGLSVAEAMASCRPAIVSALPALTETVGMSGFMVPVADPSAIKDVFTRIATEPDILQRLGMQARLRAEQLFDIRRTASAYAKLLRLPPAQFTDDETPASVTSVPDNI